MNVQALVQLWNCTQMHSGTSGARYAARVLLGLYNGPRFPFDLTCLRGMDENYFEAAMAVIRSDATHCQREVHEWLNLLAGRKDFGCRFEHMAYWLRLKGRCKRGYLDEYPLSPEYLVIELPTPKTAQSDNSAAAVPQ